MNNKQKEKQKYTNSVSQRSMRKGMVGLELLYFLRSYFY